MPGEGGHGVDRDVRSLPVSNRGTSVSRRHGGLSGIAGVVDKPTGSREDTPNKASTVWPRIAGSVAGVLIGGLPLGTVGFGLGLLLISTVFYDASLDTAAMVVYLFALLSTLLGATVGAALGATRAQRQMKQRSSFWRAMLVAMAGWIAAPAPYPFMLASIPVALVLIAGGAVIGSGWKARPACSTESQSLTCGEADGAERL